MTPQEFIAKWKRSKLTERNAAQQHFLDLCELLSEAKPAAADPDGTEYTFERGVSKSGGGKGWADVWKRQYFAWEYKGKHKDLDEAYNQLLRYREALENPPLLVVSDMDRFEVHTNFTNSVKTVYAFDLESLAEPKNLFTLRKVFSDPNALEPKRTPKDITEEVAERFATLADGMRKRNIPADRAAHFLMKLMFCMFAEDVGLLEGKLFSRILNRARNDAAGLTPKLHGLFEAMTKGGDFGADTIKHFNGGLFNDAEVIDLIPDEIEELIRVNDCDWSDVEPSIFGTLFERTLDPDKRSQIGAHYTGKEDILTLLEPVLMAPLRREWAQVKAKADDAFAKIQDAVRAKKPAGRFRTAFEKILIEFLDRLTHIKILDPSCGSGNFLYMSIKLLLDLEKEITAYGSDKDFNRFPQVEPTQLLGIEINPYAQQLAQVVIWIGYLQWLQQNGFGFPAEPILKPFENIRRMDAIIDLTDPENPREPEWPDADFIVGNPPFLGDKVMRGGMGHTYVDSLRVLYTDRIPGGADLCCYWIEKAKNQIKSGRAKRAGLIATQNIRGGASREALKRIKNDGDIFFGISDRDWILDGASVHISMVGFDDGSEKSRYLDGAEVTQIFANLTSLVDTTIARRLKRNEATGFLGSCKGGPFDIDEKEAIGLLLSAGNPNQRPNSDLVRPVINSRDLFGRQELRWIIDTGDMELAIAAEYDAPMKIIVERVKPQRDQNRDKWLLENWWRPQRMRKEMRAATAGLNRFLVTATTSKHRIFVWLSQPILPDHKLIVFAKSDDTFGGVVHSAIHECWSRSQGTQLRERESGLNYNVQSCFETFPFPTPTDAQRDAIAQAAKELDTLRTNWLNPPEWTKQEILEFPGSITGPWARYVHDANLHGIGTVRYPRLVPKDEKAAADLKKRTLTNLYNQRPTWLDLAHKKLDAAVFAAYGWDPTMSDEDILAKLLELNLARAK